MTSGDWALEIAVVMRRAAAIAMRTCEMAHRAGSIRDTVSRMSRTAVVAVLKSFRYARRL